MANEQTSVPLYAASEVLTAANMNISAGTGVPVFATTVTRDAAFGGANEKVLAEGQLCYLSATNVVQYYDGAAWATVGPAAAGGMTLLSTTTLSGATTTITISDFTYTYLFGQITGMTNATSAGGITMKPNNSSTLFHGATFFNSNNTAGTGVYTDTSIAFITTPSRTNADNFWQFYIYNYASTTTYKGYTSVMGATRDAGGKGSGADGGYIQTNSQISSLVLANSGGNWSTGTVLIYGVK